jgi:hypothetical protein
MSWSTASVISFMPPFYSSPFPYRHQARQEMLLAAGHSPLDRTAVRDAFGEFLAAGVATASQIEFISMVIEHLTDQGVMDPALLYEPPFTDLAPTGPEKLFDEEKVSRGCLQKSRLSTIAQWLEQRVEASSTGNGNRLAPGRCVALQNVR